MKTPRNPLTTKERRFVRARARHYVDATSAQEKLARELIVRTLQPFFRGEKLLELGCSSGEMTRHLARLFARVDVLDGSPLFVRMVRKLKLPNVEVRCGLFEELEAKEEYDGIMASFVLEHVLDVTLVLRKIRRALKPDGRLFVVVPNIHSLSRQLACRMGLIPDLRALTPNDIRHGHRRAYDRVSLNRDLKTAGFSIVAQGGVFLKPFADFQMDAMIKKGIIGRPQLEGLYQLGLEYPDLAAYLYAVCEKSNEGSGRRS